MREKVDRLAEMEAQKAAWEMRREKDFHQQRQDTFAQRKVSSDLWKSQLACEQLDNKMVYKSAAILLILLYCSLPVYVGCV